MPPNVSSSASSSSTQRTVSTYKRKEGSMKSKNTSMHTYTYIHTCVTHVAVSLRSHLPKCNRSVRCHEARPKAICSPAAVSTFSRFPFSRFYSFFSMYVCKCMYAFFSSFFFCLLPSYLLQQTTIFLI